MLKMPLRLQQLGVALSAEGDFAGAVANVHSLVLPWHAQTVPGARHGEIFNRLLILLC